MKKQLLSLSVLALFAGVAGNVAACTFSWHHYGDDSVYKRIKEQIGSVVTDDYCAKYNKGYEIVVITNNYMSDRESIGHASVGLRKRGTKDVPIARMSGYRSEKGNFVVSKSYDLATQAAIENLMDLMSDLDGYKPK